MELRKESTPRIDETPDVQPRAQEGVDDTAIARTIRMKLEKQSDFETDGLVVDVVRGVAYLHGDLKADSSFDEIVDLASSVPGVRRVQSLLHLPESEIRKPSTPTAGRR
jgi:osmotically-inducible protein OsmY